jgi:transposase
MNRQDRSVARDVGITRLKLLKRQMYGRAGFDLLRHRTLLAA